MKLSRRQFIGSTAATCALATALPAATRAAAAKGALSAERMAVFSAFIDTLIPADELGPSASGLDVPARLIAKAGGEARVIRLFDRGCEWLDGQAGAFGGGFASLPEADRERVVQMAADQPERSLPEAFFKVVLRESLMLYYGRQQSWPGVGYLGPPQPEGFEDYAEPPVS